MKEKLKILVIGSGAREHALVWKINQSKKVNKIFCAPGNAGTSSIVQNIPIEAAKIKELLDFALKEKIDLTIVGSEAPLIVGIVDLFESKNLKIIGPNKKAAQIEGSKIFAKNLMKKYSIPTAKFDVFDNYEKAVKYIKKQTFPLVIKADGLCQGKGVSVVNSIKDANDFLKKLMIDKIFEDAGEKVIIEECLFGQEVSFTVLSDGKHSLSLLPSQDHKRVNNNDTGPNTGGMGAYAPTPFANKKIISQVENNIISPILKAMSSVGYPYKGILYPGLILTKDGPKVLEFNCRFGDPETEAILPLLKTDIINLFQAILNQKLNKIQLRWEKGFVVYVVLASGGYPGHYEKGYEIKGLNKNMLIFHSGTKIENKKIHTNGGRVLGICGKGKTLKQAINNAYKYIGSKNIHFENMHYRKDIGKKALTKEI